MTTEKDSKALYVVAMLMALPASVWIRPWALIQVYEWHVRPIFGGPALSWLQAFGALLFVVLLRGLGANEDDSKDSEWTKFARYFGRYVFGPLCVVAVAWCIR